MHNLRNSFLGYNKNDVHDLIFKKDSIIDTQKKDIDYLRTENENLNKLLHKSYSKDSASQNKKRVTKLEQEHINEQMEI